MATLVELKARAKKMGYKGYSKLKKGELEKLLTTPPPKPPRTKPVSQRVPIKQVQPAKKEPAKKEDPTFLPTDLTPEERGKRMREMTAEQARAFRRRAWPQFTSGMSASRRAPLPVSSRSTTG